MLFLLVCVVFLGFIGVMVTDYLFFIIGQLYNSIKIDKASFSKKPLYILSNS